MSNLKLTDHIESKHPERRHTPRIAVDRAAKVYCPLTRRYYAARTLDVSRAGAMMSISTPRTLRTGEELEVAICWDDRAVIPQASMVKAQIARVAARIGDHQAVGVQFADEISLQHALPAAA
ncbi:MAG: PilZ domain-containing protein [Planctomycetes bacterium]|nr:PilZ domain-containing protein [Planctomycetota bacterium]